MQHRKITLFTFKQGNGSKGLCEDEMARRTVWAEVGDIGVTTKMAAVSAGKTADCQVTMLRAEYSGQSHVSIGGTVYKIADTGAADNPLRIKLLLERSKV